MKKVIVIILCSILALSLTGAMIFGLVSGIISEGNLPKYLPKGSEETMNEALDGKKILFLGSSVTYGYAAFGNSFADYLEAFDGVDAYKEAVSGTTLADIKGSSYVSRLKKVDTSLQLDAFVCQLSTNDATQGIELGSVSASTDINGFDTKTVTGAMEYIIAYAKQNFGCPVVFYTGTKYDSEAYEQMVGILYELQAKWGITIIDLWSSEKMNSVSADDYKIYMADPIHPTMAGYRDWWLPEFESALTALFNDR